MFAIDEKIRIEREHGVLVMEFSHPYNARVSKGDWLVLIFPVQCPKGRHMVLNAKTNFESAIFEKPE